MARQIIHFDVSSSFPVGHLKGVGGNNNSWNEEWNEEDLNIVHNVSNFFLRSSRQIKDNGIYFFLSVRLLFPVFHEAQTRLGAFLNKVIVSRKWLAKDLQEFQKHSLSSLFQELTF